MSKILIIEDETAVRENLLDLLEAEDYDVVSAENGYLGTKWAMEHIPDLIICDVTMPEVNGHEVLESLRQNPETATIPFIFLTAMADKTDIRKGMALGADDYLTKPFQREELLGAIATRLARQQVTEQQSDQSSRQIDELKAQVSKLQQSIDEKDSLISQFQQQLNSAIPKINVALHLLKNRNADPEQYSYSVDLLQKAYAEEFSLLSQVEDLGELLADDDVELLRQLELV
ncbi:response regulator [Romeria aff. gracilis LEGE 07310]|uniref:Response regulator n=1 Tax=Vasconcelosia minhoensis LEGE 07310 TaxID=915328 RepID=A0A8J7AQY8_9CYAN|nr:response regulator [Romeria gracilis]MBE9079365.1 response regulator [Romeria aff. gracilis LEGE 07310]